MLIIFFTTSAPVNISIPTNRRILCNYINKQKIRLVLCLVVDLTAEA